MSRVITIEKEHHAFANLEVSGYSDYNINEIYPYKITFDATKSEDGGNNSEKKISFGKEDDISVELDKTLIDKSSKEPEYIPTEEDIKAMEALLAEARKPGSDSTLEDIRKLEEEINQAKNKRNKNDQSERERENKITQLRNEIQQLENITNRTPQQEQELQNKKDQLVQLENQPQNGGVDRNPQKPTNYLPWFIGGSIILVLAVIIIYLLTRNKKKSRY